MRSKLNNAMFKYLNLLLCMVVLFLIYISIHSAAAPPLQKGEIPDSAFSVKRAYNHLEEITKLPHGAGTAENIRVRNFIVSFCRQQGFDVTLQPSVSLFNRQNRIFATNVTNIIARKKGTNNTKAVMLMGHYDSYLNAPGAGDDGSAVASMMETARALDVTGPLHNDLILLFTDGEELGLHGARAFVKESPILNEIGIVINFEGRGNSGPSNMFEVNAQNGWAINEYAKAAAHPYANSLGYEIYKLIPNSTDYTLFKEKGITGLNNAYIDGLENYHSPNDKAENMDLRSLRHHGENMLSLAKHFGNLSITKTKAPDVSYFNFIGYWFIHYPASWNFVFVVLVNLLLVTYFIIGFKKKRIRIGGLLLSVLLFIVTLGLIYLSALLAKTAILKFNPIYSHFDQSTAYNVKWYFLAISALATTVFAVIYWLLSKRMKYNNLLGGLLLTLVLLMNLMEAAMPSASYLLVFPLTFILAANLYLISRRKDETVFLLRTGIINLASVVPAVFLFSSIIYATFVAFSLGPNLPFVAIAVGLFAALLFPVLYGSFQTNKYLIALLALVFFIVAIIGGQASAGFSIDKPLQSSLYYYHDADSSKGKWLSDFAVTDKFTAPFFDAGSGVRSPRGRRSFIVADAPAAAATIPLASLISDAVIDGKRRLRIHFSDSAENLARIEIVVGDSAKVIILNIDGKEVTQSDDINNSSIIYQGVPANGFDVAFEMEAGKKLSLLLTGVNIGLPTLPGINTTYPPGIIPSTGINPNTTQIGKHYNF